jgi:hypothetical protein
VLAQRLEREVNEWEMTDSKGAGAFTNAQSMIWWLLPGLQFFKPNPQKVAIKKFNDIWKKWTTEEKLAFFQEQYNELAEKYGLPKIDLIAEDLKDTVLSDAKGQFRGDKLVIDIDNINSKDGYDTFQTLVHETRHQIQWAAIAEYREHGDQAQFPEGITLEQVKEWDANEKNYITPENDYPGYRKQPVEQDARRFGEEYVNEYVRQNHTEMIEA